MRVEKKWTPVFCTVKQVLHWGDDRGKLTDSKITQEIKGSAYSSLRSQRGHYVHSGCQVSLLSGDECLLKSGNGERTVCLPWVLSPNCLIVEIKDLFNSRKRIGHVDHA